MIVTFHSLVALYQILAYKLAFSLNVTKAEVQVITNNFV